MNGGGKKGGGRRECFVLLQRKLDCFNIRHPPSALRHASPSAIRPLPFAIPCPLPFAMPPHPPHDPTRCTLAKPPAAVSR